MAGLTPGKRIELMPRASNSLSSRKHFFKLVGTHAINVLARLAAKNAVKEQMRGEGIRMTLVPPRVITEKANAYLQQHPELYEQALERAKQMGWIKEPLVTPDLAEQNS
jgi:hypothetical protein